MATLTKHNNLKIVGLNESADIREVVKNFEVIDDGLCKFYVATLKSTNIYSVETGTNKTTLADGYGLTIAIPSNSTGAVKINVDSFTAPLVKSDGNPVTNLKQNGIYTLRYYKGNFILASGGADDVNFSTSDLLEGKTANNSDGEKVNGTMKNVGQQTSTINAGGKVVITKGYHNGTGYIQANSMSTQLNSLGVTLTGANQLINGVKAVDKNGNVITGTATIQSLGGTDYKEIVVPAHPDGYINKISLNSIGFKPSVIVMEHVGGEDIFDSYIWLKNYSSTNDHFITVVGRDNGTLDVLERRYIFYSYTNDTNQYVMFQYSTSDPLRIKCYK